MASTENNPTKNLRLGLILGVNCYTGSADTFSYSEILNQIQHSNLLSWSVPGIFLHFLDMKNLSRATKEDADKQQRKIQKLDEKMEKQNEELKDFRERAR